MQTQISRAKVKDRAITDDWQSPWSAGSSSTMMDQCDHWWIREYRIFLLQVERRVSRCEEIKQSGVWDLRCTLVSDFLTGVTNRVVDDAIDRRSCRRARTVQEACSDSTTRRDKEFTFVGWTSWPGSGSKAVSCLGPFNPRKLLF